MFGVGVSRSRFKLCRLALSRSSLLSSKSDKGIVDVTANFGPNFGVCITPSSILVSPISISVSKFHLTTKPNLEASCNAPACSDASSPHEEEVSCNASAGFDTSSPQEQDRRIWAVERLGKGKQYTDRDRKHDRIPGYVFDLTAPESGHVLIVMDKYQIQSLWSRIGEERFLGTVFNLEVFDGFGSQKILYTLPILPRRVNFDPNGLICNLGFVKAVPGAKIKLDTPIYLRGQEECIGVKKGGFLKVHFKYVSLHCSVEELPPFVVIDVTMMDIGDKVCLGELNFEVSLHSSNESSSVICEVV